MSFASPVFLVSLLLAPAAVFAHVALARWRRAARVRFSPGAPERALAASGAMRVVKAGLVIVSVALLAVAVARPQIGEEHVVIEQEGADVVIALDVSRSMLAADGEPTRLDEAIAQVELLTERLRGNRVGLVIFARTALVRSPLTTDTASLRTLVASAAEDASLVEPGSDLGAAVRAGMRALQASEVQSRAIVLVSDGEDHEGDALAAASAAASQNILFYTSGFGTLSGAAVPDQELVDGVPVVTQLDEGLLRQMAVTSPGGRYVPGPELGGLAGVIEGLDRSLLASDRQRLPVEQFQWLALAALLLLVVDVMLPERGARIRLPNGRRLLRAPATTGVLILVVIAGAACSSAAADLIADGNDAYHRGDLAEALELYRRAAVADADRPEPHYNAGLTLHRMEEYEQAAATTVRSLPIDDPADAARAYYNLGSHYALLGNLDDALAALRQSLVLDPDDIDAKYNLELVRQLMIQRAVDASAAGDAEPGHDGEMEPPGGEANLGLEGEQALSQALQAALAGLDEELTVSQALRALELARQLNAILPPGEQRQQPGSPDSPDY